VFSLFKAKFQVVFELRDGIFKLIWSPEIDFKNRSRQPMEPEPEFVKVYRAQESITRNGFRQPLSLQHGGPVSQKELKSGFLKGFKLGLWRAGTTTLFRLGS
jgi:hypothetical protein